MAAVRDTTALGVASVGALFGDGTAFCIADLHTNSIGKNVNVGGKRRTNGVHITYYFLSTAEVYPC